MQEIFAIISAILILIASPPYIFDIIKRKTKPERITWLIFSVLGVIAFVSQTLLGASWSLLFSGIDTLASILIFCLSLEYGMGGYTRLDITALIIAATGVTIAIFVNQPIISLLGVILADVSGVALTIKKTYEDPKSETTITWLLIGTASLFGIFSIKSFVVGVLLYPTYLTIANYAIPFTQFIRRKHSSKYIQ
jgi:NADH:ubiquinone oxidoreductase subunit 2 (subunit N)